MSAWNTVHRYEALSMLLHWGMAVPIVGMLSLVLHVGAVAKHELILKDGTVRRMLP